MGTFENKVLEPKYKITAEWQERLKNPPKPKKKKKKKKKKLKDGEIDEDTIPEAYKDLNHMEERLNRITELLAKAEELSLSKEYCDEVEVELGRMTNELKFLR